jgi:hypothetical protein
MKKAYFGSAVAGALLLGAATAANAADHHADPRLLAHPGRDPHLARQCSIEAQFKAGTPYCFGSIQAETTRDLRVSSSKSVY